MVTIYIIDKIIVTGEEVKRGSRDLDWVPVNSDNNIVKKMAAHFIAMFPERMSFKDIIKIEIKSTFPIKYKFTLDVPTDAMRYDVILFEDPFSNTISIIETKFTPLVSCSTVPLAVPSGSTSTSLEDQQSMIKEKEGIATSSLVNEQTSTITKEKQAIATSTLVDQQSSTAKKEGQGIAFRSLVHEQSSTNTKEKEAISSSSLVDPQSSTMTKEKEAISSSSLVDPQSSTMTKEKEAISSSSLVDQQSSMMTKENQGIAYTSLVNQDLIKALEREIAHYKYRLTLAKEIVETSRQDILQLSREKSDLGIQFAICQDELNGMKSP